MSKPATSPFFEGDFTKMMGEFKMPQINFEALMNSQRKNIEAMTAMNQAAFEGMQSLMRRQAELVRQGFEETTQTVNAIMATSTPEEKVMRQAEASKAAVDKCIANVREIADTISKCNTQAMETVSTRMGESLNELRDLIKTGKAA